MCLVVSQDVGERAIVQMFCWLCEGEVGELVQPGYM